MDWFIQLFTGHSVAHTVIILSLVISTGVALGHIKLFGISIGIAGVLFSGLAFGHFHLTVNEEILEFAREFGLILFVYTIGMQVGPGFFASFRRQGLKLNLLAISVVLLGVATALAIHFIWKVDIPVIVGLLSGAVTNTPGLGAAQQALRETITDPDILALPGMAYAVAYPFGILGIILTMIGVRYLFRINPEKEALAFEEAHGNKGAAPANYNISVTNTRLVGQQVRELAKLLHAEFVISRLLRQEKVMVPNAETVLQLGDVLHVVCSAESAERLSMVVGDVVKDVDVRNMASHVTARNILVTQNAVVGKSIRELDLMNLYGVAITRINRAGLDLVAKASSELMIGDRITVVGEEEQLKKVSVELGDSLKALNHPNILPVFIGIILGVVLGSIPFHIPGVPAPVKLGLAGGPLLVSIILARWGRVGPVVWYLPLSANLILREVGITLFLACVGLKSGGKFVETLVAGDGVYWLGMGALITIVPMTIVGIVGRYVFKLNYLTLCGLLAGSMTDPPALGFANQIASSDAPAITYASVYATVMFMRILTAQAIVLLLL